jgi:hypothetical protein
MSVDVEALKIAPGDSPFRVKGSVYLGHIDYVQRFDSRAEPVGYRRRVAQRKV